MYFVKLIIKSCYICLFFLIVYFSVTIASNSIEIYSLFEHMHIALIQTDPDFISIISNEDSGENSSDPTMESLLQDINELIIKIDEIIG